MPVAERFGDGFGGRTLSIAHHRETSGACVAYLRILLFQVCTALALSSTLARPLALFRGAFKGNHFP